MDFSYSGYSCDSSRKSQGVLLALASHCTSQKEEPARDINGNFRIQKSGLLKFGHLQHAHPPTADRRPQPGAGTISSGSRMDQEPIQKS